MRRCLRRHFVLSCSFARMPGTLTGPPPGRHRRLRLSLRTFAAATWIACPLYLHGCGGGPAALVVTPEDRPAATAPPTPTPSPVSPPRPPPTPPQPPPEPSRPPPAPRQPASEPSQPPPAAREPVSEPSQPPPAAREPVSEPSRTVRLRRPVSPFPNRPRRLRRPASPFPNRPSRVHPHARFPLSRRKHLKHHRHLKRRKQRRSASSRATVLMRSRRFSNLSMTIRPSSRSSRGTYCRMTAVRTAWRESEQNSGFLPRERISRMLRD